MEILEAQKTIDKWIKTYGVRYFDEMTNLAVLMEEVGELARIFSREFGEQSFKTGESAEGLADEMADILFVLCCLANQTGINLEEALIKNIEKKTSRDKDRHKTNQKLK
ncbi:nucleotide pyrophosphohydrolase [Chitinophagales bacterium]|jgi:NTP pyrophosphatase (non-canonical NTP hydrolase)|nr:nucleotide pyrophosphohydrolase [Chitinophagales bacterium]